MKWGLVTMAISTFFLQQDGFLSSLSSVGVPSAYLSPAIHIAFVVSAAGVVTEAAKYAAPKLVQAFTKPGRKRKSGGKMENASATPAPVAAQAAPTPDMNTTTQVSPVPPVPETTEKNARVHIAPRKEPSQPQSAFVQAVASAAEGGKN